MIGPSASFNLKGASNCPASTCSSLASASRPGPRNNSGSFVGLMTAVIKPTKDPLLFLGPGRLALAKLEQVLAGQFDAPFKLKDALGPIMKDYDYVVLDTPPSLGILTVNALVASTHLLVPIQAAYFAIEGTDDLLETYERIRARPNPGLKVLGVVITLFDKR